MKTTGPYDSDKRRLLSALSHGSIFFNALILSVGIPIAVLMVSDDPVVKENAKESINFHLNVWFWSLIFGVIATVTFGLLGFILGLLFLVYAGLAVWAIIHTLTQPSDPFRYPFILRLL
ncbi:MAG: DUF4870 domain-containing protein [Elainellaceae cyanobacterium]